jgi:hypothetical protein
MNVNRYRKNDIYSFKKDIIAASMDKNNAVYIISYVSKFYNKYEFLTKKNSGVIINPVELTDTDNLFVIYAAKDNNSFARALNDTFHNIVSNSNKSIKSFVFLDTDSNYLIEEFLKVSNQYDCNINIV